MSAVTYGCHICGVELNDDTSTDVTMTLFFVSMDCEMPVCDGCYTSFGFVLGELN